MPLEGGTSSSEIRVASIGGKDYVASSEISGLVARWNGDILAKMLKVFSVKKPSVTISKDKDPEFFEEVER